MYRPGKDVGHVDTLSCLPLPQTPATIPVPEDLLLLVEHLDTVSPVTAREIAAWTDKDPVLAHVRRYLLQGWPSHELKAELQPYWKRRDELSVMDKCVLWGTRVMVPPPGREQPLEELHETHPGVARMKSLARSYVWWPNINADLESKVRACGDCQVSRPPPAMSPLHPWEWPEKPWSRLHPDYAGPFLGRMFLVLIDAHSKWLDVITVSATTSSVTIEKLRAVFATHGLPQRIVTDNGTVFTSVEFKNETYKPSAFLHLCAFMCLRLHTLACNMTCGRG